MVDFVLNIRRELGLFLVKDVQTAPFSKRAVVIFWSK